MKPSTFGKYAKRNGEVKAKARTGNVPGEMNSHEEKYAERLEADRRAGRIDSWQFEPMALHLAENLQYLPDFLVVYTDGTIEIHEVKGIWRKDAKSKIKMAATAFPMFIFRSFRLNRGRWEEKEFKPR